MLGETVGSYRIARVLGKGGIGVVYAGEHNLLPRPAAVKVLNTAFSSDPDMVGRFFNEARASSLIKHPGIVEIYDFGRRDDGTAYIIMELLEGESLGHRLDRKQPLTFRTTTSILRQIAAALGAAHRKHIVHRDLKPDNVFLSSGSDVAGAEQVKILDFGIAKLQRSVDAPVTQAGSILGTPLYMAPEQCRGAGEIDHRTDIYALGCIAYEMATGQPPFKGAVGDIIVAHMKEKPRPPRSLDPSIGADFEALILQMLAKKPADRPQSMESVIVLIDELAPPPAMMIDSIDTTLRRGNSSGEISTATTQVDPTTRLLHRSLGRNLLLGGAGAAVALAIGYGGLRLLEHTPGRAAPVERTVATAREPAPVVTPLRVVRLAVDSKPPGAAVLREGSTEILGYTPFEEHVSPADGERVYVLRLAGYRDARVALRAGQDGRETAELDALPPAPPVLRPRPARAKAEPPPVVPAPPAAAPAPSPPAEPTPPPEPIKDGTVDPFAE